MPPARTFLILSALMPVASLVACVENEGPPTASAAGVRQCFRPQQVNGFSAENRDTVYLNVGVRDIYRADIVATCPDIDWSQRIAIRSTGGSSWICQGLDAEFIVPGPTHIDRCPVVDIRKLSDAEAQAWRDRHRH